MNSKTLMVDRKTVMEAAIVRTLKRQPDALAIAKLYGLVAKSITSFSVVRADFDTILDTLHTRDFVSVDKQAKVSYVP